MTPPYDGFYIILNFFFVIFTKYLAFFLLKCYNAKLRVCVKYLQKGE